MYLEVPTNLSEQNTRLLLRHWSSIFPPKHIDIVFFNTTWFLTNSAFVPVCLLGSMSSALPNHPSTHRSDFTSNFLASHKGLPSSDRWFMRRVLATSTGLDITWAHGWAVVGWKFTDQGTQDMCRSMSVFLLILVCVESISSISISSIIIISIISITITFKFTFTFIPRFIFIFIYLAESLQFMGWSSPLE